jgi:serine/threonine-protein kinase
VHRDLKPENVMGHRNAGGTLEVKVLDLGLAKLRATEQYEVDTMTQEGMIMGTPNYMSPEQLLGREVDPRSDIFAIGVMLIEVLTGQRPRPGGIREGSGPALPTAALPAALRTLLASCLATEPDARPASARALGASLRPLLT